MDLFMKYEKLYTIFLTISFEKKIKVITSFKPIVKTKVLNIPTPSTHIPIKCIKEGNKIIETIRTIEKVTKILYGVI